MPAGPAQQQSMGWPGFGGADPNAAGANSRPKSAGITGTTGNGGGLMSSLTGAGRPSSSTQLNGGGANNWGPVGGAAPQQAQQQGMAGAQSNANTLSYGSLKNRFLSGSSGATSAKVNGAAPTSSAAPMGSAAGSSGAAGANKSSSSKLFSLAR